MKKKNLSINPIQPGDLRGDHFDWVSGGGGGLSMIRFEVLRLGSEHNTSGIPQSQCTGYN